MDLARLETLIEAAFDDRDNIGVDTQGEVRDAVNATLEALDNGSLRVAEREGLGQWRVNQWAKKAVLLGFRLNDMSVMDNAQQARPGCTYFVAQYSHLDDDHVTAGLRWNISQDGSHQARCPAS